MVWEGVELMKSSEGYGAGSRGGFLERRHNIKLQMRKWEVLVRLLYRYGEQLSDLGGDSKGVRFRA